MKRGCIFLANGQLSPLRLWHNVVEAVIFEAAFRKFWGATYESVALDKTCADLYRHAFISNAAKQRAINTLTVAA
jgi:hypothetical protein